MVDCKYVRLNKQAREEYTHEAEYLGEVIHAESGYQRTRVKWYDHNRVFVKIEDVMDHLLEVVEF